LWWDALLIETSGRAYSSKKVRIQKKEKEKKKRQIGYAPPPSLPPSLPFFFFFSVCTLPSYSPYQ
jgi:hypothetical protein